MFAVRSPSTPGPSDVPCHRGPLGVSIPAMDSLDDPRAIPRTSGEATRGTENRIDLLKSAAEQMPPPMPFVAASGLFCLLTWYILGLHSLVQNKIQPNAERIVNQIRIIAVERALSTHEVTPADAALERVTFLADEVYANSGMLRRRLQLYHVSGLAALACALIAIRRATGSRREHVFRRGRNLSRGSASEG